MNAKKRSLVIVLCCVGTGLLLVAAWVFFHFVSFRSYELILPDYNDLKGVALTYKGKEVEQKGAFAEDVLFILKGNNRSTKFESVQDAPVNVEEEALIKVDFLHTGGGVSTVFVYHQPRRDGEFFIEQPYNGIYEISGDEYNSILRYASES
ncbi:DUF5301 domain-containing protein [Acutalibacter intestini]|uniref:DUF5301 domain-containing protein n=1 Tax=Acutalibacter intestini TaxID=3093659 RepID=UPI002AC8FB4C|nr:DUF5301 domain-containing protein [Acutalibacter sp. M00204]